VHVTASIKVRIAFSFLGNILRSALTVITSILLARGLGPTEFGQFGFLLASFTALTQLLDMGSSNAFLTFISKKIRSRLYLFYYSGWLIIQFLVMFLFITLLAPDYVIQKIWLGESKATILLAFVAVFFQQNVWLTISRLGESQRLTGLVQVLSVGIGIAHLLLVCILLYLDSVTVSLLFQIIAIEIVIALAIAVYIFPLQFAEATEPLSSILNEYKAYCKPLIPLTWIALIAAFSDTWLLQLYGGAEEQAYYAVASQFAVICLIATRSILNILWKEIAEAYSNSDMATVRLMFERSTKGLFYLGAMISGFFIPWTDDVIRLTLGEMFLPGVLTMMIMFLYPVDQARGQVTGTLLLATEQTRATFIIGAVGSVAGTVMTYFMLAPVDATVPGLELGALGLAIKMVIIQFISVNVSIWWINRKIQLKNEYMYQFFAFGFFIGLGLIWNYIITSIIYLDSYLLPRLIVGGMCYLLTVIIFIINCPTLFGITQQEIERAKLMCSEVFKKLLPKGAI
jgi:O-antigen/teichoic acid export membrane protein